ncbi:MAG: tetraprenyl-beta-curcumene synthase family protein [Clostridia bacterium]|jgi:tetraprenyl-beta-curcumene synthase|nr:tetraprenyl-beta-curcumene synthase family protein [Clostridia bacterium]
MLREWRQLNLIKSFVTKIFPLVDRELEAYLTRLQNCPCEELRVQAQASIRGKRFHAQGGSIYALYPGVETGSFVSFVVALQTISDYLDNLCDRAGVSDEQSFRQLHLAMITALDPDQEAHQDYYKYYPYKDDGGYLLSLVNNSQQVITGHFPAYRQVKNEILALAGLYSDLQSLKHIDWTIREERLLNWANQHKPSELSPWEFAAATGSTLGMFMLAAASSSPDLPGSQVQKIKAAYFPWITGLHILLDYFIDQEEDRAGGDLNFVFYYQDRKQCEERLKLFLEQSLAKAKSLPEPLFHVTVVEGLLAMYLSDPKALQGDKREISLKLLAKGGPRVRLLHWICQKLRQKNKL